MDPDLVIDGMRVGNETRYINHAKGKDENVEAKGNLELVGSHAKIDPYLSCT